MPLNRVAMYARISPMPEGTVGDNFSLASQVQAMTKLAGERFGCPRPVEFREYKKSGSTLDRPELDRLRDAIARREFDAVICYSPDRWSRDVSDSLILMEEVRKGGAQLVFVSGSYEDTPEGEFAFTVQQAASAFERKKLRERSRRCRMQKAREGFMTSGSVPFAYKYIGHKQGERGRLEIIPEQAAVVVRIFNWVVDGATRYEVAEWLNADKIPTQSGKRWRRGTIAKILSKTAYYGMAAGHAGIPIPCPEIITKETFEAAAAAQKANKPKWVGRPPRQYLLTSLLWCAKCGHRVNARMKRTRGSYLCANQDPITHHRRCDSIAVEKNEIETAVWTLVTDAITQTDMLAGLVQAYYDGVTGGRKQGAKDPNLAKLERARRGLENAMEALTDPDRPMSYTEAKKLVQARQREVSELESTVRVSAGPALQMPKRAVLESLTREMQGVKELDRFEDRRKVLTEVVKKIELSATGRDFTATVELPQPGSNWNRGERDGVNYSAENQLIRFVLRGSVAA